MSLKNKVAAAVGGLGALLAAGSAHADARLSPTEAFKNVSACAATMTANPAMLKFANRSAETKLVTMESGQINGTTCSFSKDEKGKAMFRFDGLRQPNDPDMTNVAVAYGTDTKGMTDLQMYGDVGHGAVTASNTDTERLLFVVDDKGAELVNVSGALGPSLAKTLGQGGEINPAVDTKAYVSGGLQVEAVMVAKLTKGPGGR